MELSSLSHRPPNPPARRLQLIAPDNSVAPVPDLDADQQRVVQHRGGPLLVLAGPGTGKTTTLVEAVVRRIESATGPAMPLVLTFSRRAAAELRARISARLGRSVQTPLAMTFHSFCYALIRRFGDQEVYGTGVRLLTAPEQEFRVRETLAGADRSHWPSSVGPAYETRAFAGEVRAVLARARQLGMDPEDLVLAGERAGRPEWVGAGEFMAEYLEVLDFEQVLDYAELVHRCRILLTDPQILATLRAEIDHIFVDEYQDTDPSQVLLLHDIAGPGGNVTAVGDPNQSIYAFRGARARGILDFPTHFASPDGTVVPVVALGHTRRFGTRIAAASAKLAHRLPLHRALPAEVMHKFRNPVAEGPAGRVDVRTYDSVGAEAEHIADLLRQTHLHQSVPWEQMAVLVRSGASTIPALSRSLAAAGVPIEVAGDEIGLASEMAVRPLVLALEVIERGREMDADDVTQLLLSPLGGLDSLDLRRLRRALREAERIEIGGAPPLSDPLLARAMMDPERFLDAWQTLEAGVEAGAALDGQAQPSVFESATEEAPWDREAEEELAPPDPVDLPEVGATAPVSDAPPGLPRPGSSTRAVLRRAATLARLLMRIEEMVIGGASAEDALWALWSGTNWPQRLRTRAVSGGEESRRANRDLDAVCSLFEVAQRSEEIAGRRGLSSFLAEVAGQQIPADTQRESDLRGGAVRVMTAHRAKGLEWDLVVVASVSEGGWPDLRQRGTMLEPDRLSRKGLADVEPSSVRLAEERRLFYVACTRARRHLVVTSVQGTEGEGDQPSRFLSELGSEPVHVPGRPKRPLTLNALVGELRRVSVDEDQPPQLREAAAVRLAKIADAVDDEGFPLSPHADPARWWGMNQTFSDAGIELDPGGTLSMSGSTLGSLLSCPRQWFLSRRANAESGRHTAASMGQVMHLMVQHAASHDTDPLSLTGHLDRIWENIDFDAKYLSARERVDAEAMLERFAQWRDANQHRELLGTEVKFRVPLVVDAEELVLTGTVDRLERESDGRLRIIDFKTGRSVVDKSKVPSHEQLGFYQLAAQQGAFDALAPGERRVSGADLVYLGKQASGDLPWPEVRSQESLDLAPQLVDAEPNDQPTWVHQALKEASEIVRSQRFDATVGAACKYCAFASSCPALGAGKQVVQ